MKQSYTVEHHEHSTTRGFDEVVRAFEDALGSVEGAEWQATAGSAVTVDAFEQAVQSREGSSGFMRFLTIDHGAWMSRYGSKARARLHTIGNPLIARTMLEHNIAAGLNVPVRVLIYEDQGTTRLAYDLPSSLMSVFGDEALAAAAQKLDAKLAALAVMATGSEA